MGLLATVRPASWCNCDCSEDLPTERDLDYPSTRPNDNAMKPQPLPPWLNQPLQVFHGTDLASAQRILTEGIDLGRNRFTPDFGPGFHVTTLRDQAWEWAVRRNLPSPSVVQFEMSRDALARARCLFLLDRSESAEDYWSFVSACRLGVHTHSASEHRYYDVVAGPLARSVRKRFADPHRNQISVHTRKGVNLLVKGRLL